MARRRRGGDRSFEDMVRRSLRPGPALKRSMALSRPIDGQGKPMRRAVVPIEYKALADRIGMKHDTFHNKVDGESAFWASEARAILAHAPDIELADWFLEGTPWMAAHRLDALHPSPGLLGRLVQNAVVHFGDLVGVVDRALSDHIVSLDEQDAIYRKVLELETAVAAMRKLVEPDDAAEQERRVKSAPTL
jgi:hypothetical protein